MSTEELNDQADFADDELIIRKKKQPEQKTGVTAALLKENGIKVYGESELKKLL